MHQTATIIYSGGGKMGYLDNMVWEKIKKELQIELEKGLGAIKDKAIVMQKMAEEWTEEGKRQYKMLSTKAKINEAMRDLGAKVYLLMSGARVKNPALDARVKDITARIKSLKAELAKLEGKGDVSSVRAAPRPRAAVNAKARRKAGVTPRTKAPRRVRIKNSK
jgi:cell division protein FtsB